MIARHLLENVQTQVEYNPYSDTLQDSMNY